MSRGFSLIEVLVALAVTLVVMALVVRTMGDVTRIYDTQSALAVSSAAAALALDDLCYELSLAGAGLGEGPAAVLPRRPGSPLSSDALTVRSNPEVKASAIHGELVPDEDVAVDPSAGFQKDELVLVTDSAGGGESALVVRAGESAIALNGFEGAYSPLRSARVLGLREVQYFLTEAREPGKDARRELVKRVVGVGDRVLSRDVLSLAFEYLDAESEPISLAKVEATPVASVRVALRFLPGDDAVQPKTFATRIALEPRSATVDFERRDLGFRLSRMFFPIDNPAGVASRLGSRFAMILASGKAPNRDPAYLYTFEMEKSFLNASVDDAIFLEDVRAPVTLAFGPEGGPLAGSLFVAAWGLRIGHLSRIAPDSKGELSRESSVTTFEGTEAIAQAGGLAFGVDGALYVASQEKGTLFRFRFRADGNPEKPERLFPLTGTPGAIVEGTDGHLYFLMNHREQGSLWKVPFDETLSPKPPERVAALPGYAISLSRDPVSGSLFALVREPTTGDSVVLELGRAFLKGLAEPKRQFSLGAWREGIKSPRSDPRELPVTTEGVPALGSLEIEDFDFLSFDLFGSLYLGSRRASLVLKFELARPSGRYRVGLSAGVLERGGELPPSIRMHAWRKSAF